MFRITAMVALFSAAAVAAEDGLPRPVGMYALAAPTSSAAKTKAKKPAKKKKKPAKKKRVRAKRNPAIKRPTPPAPPSESATAEQPEPFNPRVWFTIASRNDWYLQLHTDLGKVDLYRNLRINGTFWAHHDRDEIRRFRLTDIGELYDLASRSGREHSEVEPLCADDSAVAFSHWSDKTDTVRVAYREMLLDGERVVVSFRGQWPAWNNHLAAYAFDEMVCTSWIWWEKPL